MEGKKILIKKRGKWWDIVDSSEKYAFRGKLVLKLSWFVYLDLDKKWSEYELRRIK